VPSARGTFNVVPVPPTRTAVARSHPILSNREPRLNMGQSHARMRAPLLVPAMRDRTLATKGTQSADYVQPWKLDSSKSLMILAGTSCAIEVRAHSQVRFRSNRLGFMKFTFVAAALGVLVSTSSHTPFMPTSLSETQLLVVWGCLLLISARGARHTAGAPDLVLPTTEVRSPRGVRLEAGA
jgi:hypothetical protein